MRAIQRHLQPALVTPLLLSLAALLVRPVLEEGVNDDWSYTKTAQILAATGHIVYNGWATAMLGWQLYWADLFIHLFGFSFTAVRLSTLPVALAMAVLIYLCFVACGIHPRNAVLGTCTLSLSPLFLPLTFTFMTDVYGLFAVVLCLFACLRTVSAERTWVAIVWLSVAVVGGALGGTARQIVWLTILVMVPCLLWLIRQRRAVLFAGLVLELFAIAFVAQAMSWFSHKPLTLPEHLMPIPLEGSMLHVAFVIALQALLELTALLLPVLIAFVPAVRWSRTAPRVFLVSFAAALLLVTAVLTHRHKLRLIAQPTLQNTITAFAIIDIPNVQGDRIPMIPVWAGALTTAVALLSLAAMLSVWCFSRRSFRPHVQAPSAAALRVLLLPFVGSYLALLLPRALSKNFFDRYLLEVMFFATIGILLCYQTYVGAKLPWTCGAVALLFALFAIAGTHDRFAMARAELEAIRQLERAGVPANQIAGGFEFNSWNEVERTGFVADPRLRGQMALPPPTLEEDPGDRCPAFMQQLVPHLERRFALAFRPDACLGPTSFAPVTYTRWLPLRQVTLYVVRDKAFTPAK